MKNFILQNLPSYVSNKNFKSKLKAFTLAEILLSLTVIGIVAAIALPSLLGNANERAWETQKKALYTRFSQALPLLPSLNGYGELVGNLPSATGNDRIPDDQLKDTAAESFIRDGLSKVMKITNICDNEHLSDCGLPDKIIPLGGGSAIELSSIKSLGNFNNTFSTKIENENYYGDETYEQLDTKASAFETVNGESILVYYNPNCIPDIKEGVNSNSLRYYFSHPKMCANFVYDLNGKKGPNTVGKDIGTITALYSTTPIVVAPNPYPENLPQMATFDEAMSKCREMDSNAKVPNKEELASMFYNVNLFNIKIGGLTDFWSSTAENSNYAWRQGMAYGGHAPKPRNESRIVRCIKR